MEDKVVVEAPILDENTQEEFIRVLEASFKGEVISDHEATLLFYWARHQNDKMFDFVPKKYRIEVDKKSTAKAKKKSNIVSK